MVSPWQRHLLVMAGELEEDTAAVALSPETALVAAAALLVLVMLVLLCVCGNEGSSKNEVQRNGASKRNANSTKAFSTVSDPTAVTSDPAVEGETNHLSAPGETAPLSNGAVQSGGNGSSPFGHSREASSGSAQMRPTSLRELPDLPVTNHKRNHSGAGIVDKPTTNRNSTEDSKDDHDAYDHLGAKIVTKNVPAQNYDHINLESPRDPSSGTTPASEPDTASEGHYAQVRERTYDVVKDIRARASTKSTASTAYDPYAKVKDEDDDKDDPYARVKDDPYSRLKDDPYSRVKDVEKDDVEDDYAHLKHDHVIMSSDINTPSTAMMMVDDEDPYEKVIGDSSGGMRVVPAPHTLDTDDPYSVVTDQPPVVVVPLNSGGSPTRTVSHSPGGGWGSPPRAGGAASPGYNLNNAGGARANSELLRLQFADEDGDSQDDYATVVKDRNPSTSREEMDVGGDEDTEMIDPYFTTTPPTEPPRMYGANEVGGLPGAVGGAAGDEAPSSRRETKEHRYTKVTARESLASMSARNALNTYEIVPDLPENTYATVEGGSGDGVVRYNTQGTPTLQHSNSQMSETYAEIGASGGYAIPAPEPPSLHSLHTMTKSTSSIDGDHGNSSRPPTSPSSSSHPNVIIADDGYAVVSKVSGFSPSETALPQIPDQGMSGSVGSLGSLGDDVLINGVTLHPDYHSVKDCIPDQDNENDPNYESVDEAFSKVPTSSGSNPLSSPGVKSAHSSAAGATSSSHVTVINHVAPSRGASHQYEEVSPPASPLSSSMSQALSRVSAGMAGTSSSNGASSNSTSSSGLVLKNANTDVEAAEVRDRVLQGHMYEAISEVKTRKKSEKSDANQRCNSDFHNVKL